MSFYITDISNDLSRKAEFLKSRKGNSEAINVNSLITSKVFLDGTIYTPSEDLLYLYKKHGTKLPSILNGSFSFVIYDHDRNILFGARDRLGEKPLFYSLDNGFECSPSLKAICAGNRFSISDNARKMYIRFGWIYDTECIFNEVRKIPAGHSFTYDLTRKTITIEKYWEFSRDKIVISEKDAIEKLDSLIRDSVSLRIDKCIGMGISSGTDSFSIYNYTRELGIDIPLFCIIPKHKSSIYNEFPKALEHVKSVDSFKEINGIVLSDGDCILGLEDYVKFYDEPNSDFSCIITTMLFRKMREYGISIALSGIGSDDILFGKPIYGKYANKINDYLLSTSVLRRAVEPIECYNDFRELLDPSDPLSMQRYNIKTYLPNLLVKEDIASQNNGIEIRSPFCDYRVFEYADSISHDLLFKNNTYKYLLKILCLQKFKVNFFQDGKRGFAPQITELIMIKEIRDKIADTLTKDIIEKFFPELQYIKVKNALFDYTSVFSSQLLLNLYLYVSIIKNYDMNIFK